MAIKDPKELFVMILSNVRQGTERSSKIFQELSQVAQNPDVKEAFEARVFVSQQILQKLDQCFKLIGEKPVQLSGRLQEVFLEDCRRELSEIESGFPRLAGVVSPHTGEPPFETAGTAVVRNTRQRRCLNRARRPRRRGRTVTELLGGSVANASGSAFAGAPTETPATRSTAALTSDASTN